MQTSKTTPNTATLVINTKKPYTPNVNTAQNNAASWAVIQGALKGGKPVTRLALTQLLATQCNHAPFVGYAIRRGWLVTK